MFTTTNIGAWALVERIDEQRGYASAKQLFERYIVHSRWLRKSIENKDQAQFDREKHLIGKHFFEDLGKIPKNYLSLKVWPRMHGLFQNISELLEGWRETNVEEVTGEEKKTLQKLSSECTRGVDKADIKQEKSYLEKNIHILASIAMILTFILIFIPTEHRQDDG